MIKNQRQYNMAKSQLKKFADAIGRFDQKARHRNVHPRLVRAEKEALQSQHLDFQEQIDYYDSLKKSGPIVLKPDSLEDIPVALIKARISLGLTQKDLAEILGLKEQQIQRYEATEYSTASIARVREIILALNKASPEDADAIAASQDN